MPGGPIDPTHLISILQSRSTWENGELHVDGKPARVEVARGGWIAVHVGGYPLPEFPYRLLMSASSVRGGTFSVWGRGFQLAVEESGGGWTAVEKPT